MGNPIRKKIPIGNEFFEDLRNGGYYYVDKTGFIRDLLQNGGQVSLFTRPRRFGKTLNMSMLQSFFETGCAPELFEGLEIAGEKSICEEYMGRFPVVSISLKNIEGEDFTASRSQMCAIIGKEALRYQFLLESSRLTSREKALYSQLIAEDPESKELFPMSDAVLCGSLQTLSSLLHKHYGQKAIILIDEYDVPLAKAFDCGYYDQMVLFIRNLFGQALKTNHSLQFAVLTGCLRIAKESIFTGFNNLNVFSVLDGRFAEYFGFTDREVKDILEYYRCPHCYGTVKECYDGYQFGQVGVYCPWDVLNYCDRYSGEGLEEPQDYWVNTSGNDIIRRFLEKSDAGTAKRELEKVIAGEPVEKKICQELTYRGLYDSMENLWSVLLATGYLTQRGKLGRGVFQLAIPNMEIRDIFTSQIMEYFQEKVGKDGAALEAFCKAFQNGDAIEVERRFQEYLKKTISIRDSAARNDLKENFYHGILLGLLGYKEDWVVSSNKESGKGYSDILVELEEERIGIVIELKYAGKGQLETKCQEALEQIEGKGYDAYLREEGMQTILKYGIACEKKECKVLVRKED